MWEGAGQASTEHTAPESVKRVKMPKIDTLDALEEHEEHDDDYQTITNWNAN